MTEKKPLVAVCMAVHPGAVAWLPMVLDSLVAQDYPREQLQILIQDNASRDGSTDIAREKLAGHRFSILSSQENIGVWAAFEKMTSLCDAEYYFLLTDILLAPSYISEIIRVLEQNPNAGAAQGKLLRMDRIGEAYQKTDIIDGAGFRVAHSRRVSILGHGESDGPSWNTPRDIFGVEGAAPIFRKAAWDDCRVQGAVVDPDFRVGSFGYGDDFDIAWRMTLFGWRQLFVPTARGWHDRSTTKSTGSRVANRIARRSMRRNIPVQKRRLDWSNVRLARIKNERMIDVLRDLPRVFAWEVAVQGYFLLFEPGTLAGWGRFLRLLPRMLRQRHIIQQRARRASIRSLLS